MDEMTLPELFWSRVERNGPNGCWTWLGARAKSGYGTLSPKGHTTKLAHRISYELNVGPIPEGLQLDHLCRVRECVNPEHLEPVTQRENLLRSPLTLTARNAAKTHCHLGHEFVPSNTKITIRNQRVCLACRRIRDLKRRPRARAGR